MNDLFSLTPEEDGGELVSRLEQLSVTAPSPEFMARLRAARPELKVRRLSDSPQKLPARRAWSFWTAGAAAAVVFGLVWWAPIQAPHTDSTAHVSPQGAPVTALLTEPVVSPASVADEVDRIYLPVDINRRLVRLEPAQTIQRPDESPIQLVRAVWIEEITAVGASSDEALQLSRTREAYVPVSSPIFY